MKNKIKSIFYIITLSFLSCTLNAGEWVNMFDGKTLDGWKVNTENPKTFSVVDGTIKFLVRELICFTEKMVMQSSRTLSLSVRLRPRKEPMQVFFSTLLIRRMDGLKLVMRPK